MSSAIQRGPSLQSISFDEGLGVIQVQSESIDDSTVKTMESEVAIEQGKSSRPTSTQVDKLHSVPENSETVEDVRAWAKEASFKLRSFNFKIPGGNKGAVKGRSTVVVAPPSSKKETVGIAIPNAEQTSVTTTATNSSADSADDRQQQEPTERVNEKEETENLDDAVVVEEEVKVIVTQLTERVAEIAETSPTLEEAPEEREPDSIDEEAKETPVAEEPEQEEVEDRGDASTINTVVTKGFGKSKSNDGEDDDEEDDNEAEEGDGKGKSRRRRTANDVDYEGEGEDENDITKGIALRPTSQNVFVKAPTSPQFTNVHLRPVPKVVESKKFNMHSSASISTFVNLKAVSRDSVSTLSHDEDQLSVQSEPIPRKRPTERVITPYDQLKKINRSKMYGDYIPEELEFYLSDEEFQKVLGKSRPDFYALPLWKQQFLKKRAQLF